MIVVRDRMNHPVNGQSSCLMYLPAFRAIVASSMHVAIFYVVWHNITFVASHTSEVRSKIRCPVCVVATLEIFLEASASNYHPYTHHKP